MQHHVTAVPLTVAPSGAVPPTVALPPAVPPVVPAPRAGAPAGAAAPAVTGPPGGATSLGRVVPPGTGAGGLTRHAAGRTPVVVRHAAPSDPTDRPPRPRDDARRERNRRRHRDHAGRLLGSALVLLSTLAIGGTGTTDPGMAAFSASMPGYRPATLPGTPAPTGAPVYDVSWPQCREQGGVQPMPPADAAGLVIGITGGKPFTRNSCLATQAAWASAHRIPVHVYTVPGYPTTPQLAMYAAAGPWRSSTTVGRLRNVGYAEGRAALAALAAAGLRPAMVWIDVEQRAGQPWPTGTAAKRAGNRWVVEGLIRSLTDVGIGFGIYANPDGWRTVTGPWWLPGVPGWAAVGRAGAAAAQARCTSAALHGGPLYLVQWTDTTFDYDIPCRPFTTAPPLPPTPQGFGDLDGDWSGDLLARQPSGKLWRYPGNAAGGWQPRRLVGSGWQAMDVVEPVGDLSGDGRPDVLAREKGTGRVWLYRGSGTGGFASRLQIATGWQGLDVVVGAGDVTGDGIPDVVARDTAGRLWLYPGTGHDRLGTRRQLGRGWQMMDRIVATGDLTGDGYPDLVAREKANGRLWLYAGTGDGRYAPRRQVGTGWLAVDRITGVGDVTGDGVPDLAARDRAGVLWVYPGDGAGGWRPRVRSGTGWGVMDLLS